MWLFQVFLNSLFVSSGQFRFTISISVESFCHLTIESTLALILLQIFSFLFAFPPFQFRVYLPLLSNYCMEKAMAPHSSTLAWKIPWMEEPGRLQSMGSLGVGHDWATSLSFFTFTRWRRKWQPTPVFGVTQSQTWLKWLSSSSFIARLSSLFRTSIFAPIVHSASATTLFTRRHNFAFLPQKCSLLSVPVN